MTPIDIENDQAGTPVPVGAMVAPITMTPDGRFVFVASTLSNYVTQYNTVTGQQKIIPVGLDPVALACSPDGSKVYVVNQTDGTISVITVADMAVTTVFTMDSNPGAIAVTPDGSKAVLCYPVAGTVKIVNLTTGSQSSAITVGTDPIAVAIDTAGGAAYVANQTSSNLSKINIPSAVVSATLALGHNPTSVVYNSPGTGVNWLIVTSVTQVIVINIAGFSITSTNPVGSGLTDIAITPDAEFAYVTDGPGNQVFPILLNPFTVQSPIAVGATPSGIVISPDQSPTAAFTVISPPHNGLNNGSFETGTESWVGTGGTLTSSTAWSVDGTHSLQVSSTAGGTVSATSPTGTSGAPVTPGQNVSGIATLHTAVTARVVTGTILWYQASGAPCTHASDTIGSTVDTTSLAGAVLVGQRVAPAGAAFMALRLTYAGTATSELHYIDEAGLFYGNVFAWAPATALTVNFTDASTTPLGTILSWAWNFGDGNTSTLQNPTHTYATAGTYAVSLTVTNSGETSTTVTYTGQVVSNNGFSTARKSLLVRVPAIAPGAPVIGSALSLPGAVRLSWTNGTDNQEAITGFTITPSKNGVPQTAITIAAGAVGGPLDPTPFVVDTFVMAGLVNGADYTFTVATVNGGGTSSVSAASNPAQPNADIGDFQGSLYQLIITPPNGTPVELAWRLLDGLAEAGQWTITENWGRQSDTASFFLVDEHAPGVKNVIVPPMSLIEMFDLRLGEVIFGGVIDDPLLGWQATTLDYWTLNCDGYQVYLTTAEPITYENSAPFLPGTIVLDLMTNGGQTPPTGYDTWFGVKAASITAGGFVNDVDGSPLTGVQFQNATLIDCLTNLAMYASSITELWAAWVDEDRNLHFDRADIEAGPVAVFTDTPTAVGTQTTGHIQAVTAGSSGDGTGNQYTYEWNATDLRNVAQVAGTSVDNQWTDHYLGDGTTQQWQLSFAPDTSGSDNGVNTVITLTLAGSPVTVDTMTAGQAPTTDFVLVQGLNGVWTLQTGTANPPSSGQALVLTYAYASPILLQVESNYVAQGANPYNGPNRGVFAEFVSDSSITSFSAALARGEREIGEYQFHQEIITFSSGEDYAGHVRAGDVIQCDLSQTPDSQNAWSIGFSDLFVVTAVTIEASQNGLGFRMYSITAVRTFQTL